ncbi:DUF4190 domain-containing protein [Mycoplasma tauri]|uniref:DUF4190 domain-containing protein n=1 Tax=Mycoplasma tauri TaxID=547987 RepID=UPI0019675B11|nr:DUF4190 domain-containing protein [Mycoplasma tauri]QSB07439.1 DUF4190 domain-containing protein [Mycoplasma tauri]
MKLFICETCDKKIDEGSTSYTECKKEIIKIYEIPEETQLAKSEPVQKAPQIVIQNNMNLQQMNMAPVKVKSDSNGLANAGIIFAFIFPPLGLIFSLIGLYKSKKMNGKGKVLSIVGIFISIITLILFISILASSSK